MCHFPAPAGIPRLFFFVGDRPAPTRRFRITRVTPSCSAAHAFTLFRNPAFRENWWNTQEKKYSSQKRRDPRHTPPRSSRPRRGSHFSLGRSPHRKQTQGGTLTPNQVGLALVLLGVMVLLGKTMRIKWGWTQKLFLP